MSRRTPQITRWGDRDAFRGDRGVGRGRRKSKLLPSTRRGRRRGVLLDVQDVKRQGNRPRGKVGTTRRLFEESLRQLDSLSALHCASVQETGSWNAIADPCQGGTTFMNLSGRVHCPVKIHSDG